MSELQATIDRFESVGNVTFYCISVVYGDSKHEVSRHYSEFISLRSSLISRYPPVELCMLPGKSILFNSFQFTKEFRKQRFDEFLQIVISLASECKHVCEFLKLPYSDEETSTLTAAVDDGISLQSSPQSPPSGNRKRSASAVIAANTTSCMNCGYGGSPRSSFLDRQQV